MCDRNAQVEAAKHIMDRQDCRSGVRTERTGDSMPIRRPWHPGCGNSHSALHHLGRLPASQTYSRRNISGAA